MARAAPRSPTTRRWPGAAVARAETQLDRLPDAPREPAPVPAEAHAWRVGERAKSRTGGWEGRVAALERGGKRATLEAGGMRVTVALADLEPIAGLAGSAGGDGNATKGAGGGSNTAGLRLERARSVASSLDLRGARVDEALEALGRYLDDAALAGLDQVLIIHGLGTGALRDAVRAEAAGHPLVKSVRAGERGEGGDGATIIRL